LPKPAKNPAAIQTGLILPQNICYMKSFALLLLCVCLHTMAFAQTPQKYSRVEIRLQGREMTELARLGIETDHGLHNPGHSLVTDLSATELQLVQNAGFHTTIWIDDLKKDYLERLQNPVAVERNTDCNASTVTPYQTPANYTYGSMGGYHTLDEMMAVLDDMRAKFPQLISARAPASDTIETWQGRKIWYVKISDNPDIKEQEPEVLYNALHHAREPNGASQMLFFMWYLLENYNLDPEIKYIVDNAELYFIPCVNPDGYVFNQTTDPQGGGYWRKNLRDNGNGSFGVDLNRNYGYFWGNDDNGSSPNPNSDVYRGPAPFSEPETRTMRDFILEHEFVFSQNYHTFSNLLIYPWAYNNQLADPSLEIFGKLFTRENQYKIGTAIQTVGYNVNGNSDDWMFAIGGANAFTPEVGATGFWPQPNEIDDLNRENLWQNLATALCALRFGELTDKSPDFFSTLYPTISVNLRRYGYQDGPFTVSLIPLTSNIASINSSTQLVELQQFETLPLQFGVSLSPDIQIGEGFDFVLQLSNGHYIQTDTLRKQFGGKLEVAYTENGNSLNEWTGSWDRTPHTFVSAPFSITDSPVGNYPPNTFSALQLTDPVSIPANAQNPQLRFWAKWNIEPRYDFVQVRGISGGTDIPLCGRYTKAGRNGVQPFGEPVFDGVQSDWVEERMDLSAFIGQNLSIQFLLGSDNGDERDGYFFDDLRVEYTDPSLLNTVRINLQDFRLLQNEPNPASEFTVLRWDNAAQITGEATLVVFNALGAKVMEHRLQLPAQQYIRLDTRPLAPGMYTYFLQTPDGQSQALKMAIGAHR